MRSLATRPEEERKRIARAGGKKSVEVKREKKKFRETLSEILDLPMEELHGVSPRVAICKAMILKAADGDEGSAKWVRDTAGEKPVDQVESQVNVSSLDKEQRDAAVRAALLGVKE